eukprot:7000089-Pyramimonas_sp.AAC.1
MARTAAFVTRHGAHGACTLAYTRFYAGQGSHAGRSGGCSDTSCTTSASCGPPSAYWASPTPTSSQALWRASPACRPTC